MNGEHLRNKHRIQTTTFYKEVYDKAKGYIKERIEVDQLMLDDFAVHCGYSRRSIQRALSWFGTSWRRLVAALRMQHAAALLRTTDSPVKVIARQVGYRQPSQFTKAFIQETTMSPTAYRQYHLEVVEAEARERAREVAHHAS